MINPVKLNYAASVLQAMEIASNFVGETIPVIDEENGFMVGVVSEANIFDAYLATQSRVHDLEHSWIKINYIRLIAKAHYPTDILLFEYHSKWDS